MFKFDKKTSDTIKMANKYKSRIEKAEKIMNEISFPETFENRGKIKENLKLLSSTMNGIKSANTTLEKKITEINAIGNKNFQLQNVPNLSLNNHNKGEYIETASVLKEFDFAVRYIDWNKHNETINNEKKLNIIEMILDFFSGLFADEYEKKQKIADLLYEEYGITINAWDIESIKGKKGETITITLKDGTLITIFGENTLGYKDGLRVRIESSDGRHNLDIMSNGDVFSDKTHKIKLADILTAVQYGGNQMDFKYRNAELAEDPKIQEIIRRYWPNATEEDIELFLLNFSTHGCGYTASINTIFEEYAGKEDEFERKFGFPMYKDVDGVRDYNYEYLIIEYYCYIWGNTAKSFTIQEIYGNIAEREAQDGALNKDEIIETGKARGTSVGITKRFTNFLKDKYGINCDVEVKVYAKEIQSNEELIEIIKKHWSEGEKVVISIEGSDLYRVYTRDNGEEIRDVITHENVGPHAMYIVDITDEGEIIISSWGKKYILDISEPEWIRIDTYDYE